MKSKRLSIATISFAMLAWPNLAPGQVIKYVVGLPSPGNLCPGPIQGVGDGGPAICAYIDDVRNVAFDKSGNMYIADSGNNLIRKVDTKGIISTVAGNGNFGFSGDGGQATAASLAFPHSIAVDSQGNLYIGDVINHRVRKVDTKGIITTYAGGADSGFGGDGGKATDAKLSSSLEDLTLDSKGNLYIVDQTNFRVRVVDTSGIINTAAGTGSGVSSGDGGPANKAGLIPSSVVVDKDGNLYIADTRNYNVRKVDIHGIISTFAGKSIPMSTGDGGLATDAGVFDPRGLATDPAGNVYISEYSGGRVRKVDTKGIISTVAGCGTGPSENCQPIKDGIAALGAELIPLGIDLDPSGNLYIAYGGSVLKVNIGGPGGPQVSDGGVVNNASFAPSPTPVAPGSMAAVFGNNLNDGSQVLFSSFGADGKLVTTLAASNAKINNISAPMFYSTAGQIGVQIPYELAGKSSATIVVTVNGKSSDPKNIPLADVAPGIFSANQKGSGMAAALHSDGVTPVTAAKPAHSNEVIVFFGTGFGAVTPALATGVPSSGNHTVLTPSAKVDSVTSTVEFSGAAPGFVGLNQINVRIPKNTRIGSDIPIVFSVGGKNSNEVTIPVGQ